MLHLVETDSKPSHVAGGITPLQTEIDRVEDITVTLASACDQSTLQDKLDRLSSDTAFDLVGLRPDDTSDLWHAMFRLSAPNGVVGDTQIYALLRFLSGEIRWLNVTKATEAVVRANDGSPTGTGYASAS